MGMPLELNTMIVTKNREQFADINTFRLIKEGYRLYPIDIPIEVKTRIDSEDKVIAVIRKIEWAAKETIILYEIVNDESLSF